MSNVLVITNNLKQASYRLRIAALQSTLASRGVHLDIQVRSRNVLARRALLKSSRRFDAVILQRKMLDPIDTRLLRKNARKLYFDVDDAVMYHSHPVSVLERMRTSLRFKSIAKHADKVVCGNEYLAGLFQAQGARTAVLPTVVDLEHYQQKRHAESAQVRLVWIGSKSTLKYLQRFAPSIQEAGRRVPGLELITIADQALSNPPVPTEHIEWSEASESAALLRGDIGIAPTPEDRWTLGKCGFKIVQYMASGLPVIASPVGANREIVVDDQTGLLPESPGEWIKAIVTLATNFQMRRDFGAAGRERVKRLFSLDRAADFWQKLLSE